MIRTILNATFLGNILDLMTDDQVDAPEPLDRQFFNKAFFMLPLGIVMPVAATLLSLPYNLNYLVGFLGLIFYIWGCYALAKAKRRSPWILLTFFLGPILPVIILLITPARTVEEEIVQDVNRCVSCEKPLEIGIKVCPHCSYRQPE